MSKKNNKADEYIKTAYKNEKYAPELHFTPPTGWMNDPNGLFQWGGVYHLFYQFNPFKLRMGRMLWGHASSRDLVHWKHEKTALKPDRKYDWLGVWSGSAIVKDNISYLFYTGLEGAKQQQCLARFDPAGGIVKKYSGNPIIPQRMLPVKKGKFNFRDPKVVPYKDGYYMVVGGMQERHGVMYYYQSKDLFHWNYVGLYHYPEISSALECPDLFELDGRYVVLASQADNVRYYVYDRLPIEGGIELYQDKLDFGDFFYAPQSFGAEDGRRILIAWAGSWSKPIGTAEHGFAGTMTIPRELSLDDNHRLVMRPCREILEYAKTQIGNEDRKKKYIFKQLDFSSKPDYEITLLEDRISHQAIRFKMRCREGIIHVYMERDGIFRELCVVQGVNTTLEVLLDHYVAEVFLDGGRRSITENNYCGEDSILYQER